MGAFWGNGDYDNSGYIKNVGEDIKMKKYRIHLLKLYSPRDVERRIGIEREKIIAFLEKKKTIGRKMGNFWFIRGEEILGIRDSLKGNKNIKLTPKGEQKK